MWAWSTRLTLLPLIWSSAVPTQGQEKQKETGAVEGRGWELESGPYLSLLLEPCCGKRRWPPASRLRELCGSEEGWGRWEPYQGRNPHPTVVSWNCADLGSEVVMWEVDPKGVPRRVTRLRHSLSGAPAVATGSHCFAAGLPSRPMITLGDPSVLSNT